MDNNKSIKRLNGLLKRLDSITMEKAEGVIKICKDLFVEKYGLKSLHILFNEEDISSSRIDCFTVKELGEINISFFSGLYDEYLLSHQREKTGSFYTPVYIIDYMINGSILSYLARKTRITREVLGGSLHHGNSLDPDQIKKIIEAMDQVKIIDIACGTGLFLSRALVKIYAYKKRMYEALGEEITDFTIKKYIVENNIFGMDIQENPIIIAKMDLLSMVYGSERSCYGRPVQLNFVTGDSLEDTSFLKEDSIERIIKDDGGFDIVIGNPPYLGEKGNKELFDKIKNTPLGKKHYEGKMDYFYFFIYKSLEILKEDGILSYITTNYFITADGAQGLRNYLKDHVAFTDIFNFNHYEIFKSAKGQHNIIFSLRKGRDIEQPIFIKYMVAKKLDDQEIHRVFGGNEVIHKKVSDYILSDQQKLYGPNGHIMVPQNPQYVHVLDKIRKNSQYQLEQLCNINQGFVSGGDKVTRDMIEKKVSMDNEYARDIKLNQGIFVLTEEEVKSMGVSESPFLKPMFKNSDIKRYKAKNRSKRYILYIRDHAFLDISPEDQVFTHLYKYKEILDKRRETALGIRDWYALQWPRNQSIFEETKIIVPHRAKENRFALNRGPWYASADVYFITPKDNSMDWNFLLAQMNSKLMYFWLYNCGKKKGKTLELYANPLKKLPVVLNVDEYSRKKICEMVDGIMEGEEDKQAQAKIDNILYKIYGLTDEEIKAIEDLCKENLEP